MQVHDMTCDLSPSMAAIQGALMKVLEAMLKQVPCSAQQACSGKKMFAAFRVANCLRLSE
jgi:hypothetical protein